MSGHARRTDSCRARRFAVACVAVLAASVVPAGADIETTVQVDRPAVLLATISATCHRCAWDVAGREAVMLTLSLNGRYSQHVPLVRTGAAEYAVLVGTVPAGTHRLRLAIDRERTAAELRDADVAPRLTVSPVHADDPRFEALSRAPFLYERPNTVGRFSDVPVFMWYEVEPTARGTRYRYSVIFTNEDGGTPADKLMAKWGRTTDIEYMYSVEVDGTGRLLEHDMQGPDHEVLPYNGPLEGGHPSLFVVTDNNMVLDRGSSTVRFAPAPVPFRLEHVSREAVMDAHPWLYAVAAQELAREGKIVPNAPPGTGAIPDPRRYAYLEGCGTLGNHALTFAVHVGGDWVPADRRIADYRIDRDGCFRGAVPLPDGASVRDIQAVRIQIYERPGRTPVAPVRVTRLNTLFALDDQHLPGPPALQWQGEAEIRLGGPPLDLPLP